MPVNYTLFTIMKLLKEHNKETVITKVQLAKAIGEFLEEAPLPEEVKDSLIENFDLDYELEIIFDKYAEFLFNEDGVITLSSYVKMDTIDDLLDESSADYGEELINIIDELPADYGEELINIIDDFFEFNVSIFEIIGIKIETELYDKGIELERNIVNGYIELARIELCNDKIPNGILNELKRNIIMRRFVFNQIKNNLSLQEYNDLYRYSIERKDLLGTDTLALKIENEELKLVMKEDPFLRTLFFVDDDKEFVLSESFYKESKYNTDEGKTKELFYNKVIDVINNRTNKKEYDCTDDDLIYAKYRLMYAMDMLYQDEENYNGYLFLNDRKNYINYNEDYYFIEKYIFYLIDEIFMYTDNEMANNFGTDYDNTIKSILIETYYELTEDERVIAAIKNHSNYGKYHFITGLFDDMMKNCNNKTKKRELE